jgi:sulfatase modifying factor 1
MKKNYIYFATVVFFVLTGTKLSAQMIEMVPLNGATLELGATDEQLPYSFPKEFPAHKVEMPDFFIGKFEVTQNQWISVMGDNPSLNKNEASNHPVEYLDWMSAIVFCNEATLKDPAISNDQLVYFKDAAFTVPYTIADYKGEGNTNGGEVYIDYSKTGYRLPTEAEWEFAARGGLSDQMTLFAGNNDIDLVGIYTKNSDWNTYPVGSKYPNEVGAYDMSGNVWEYTNDWYGAYPTVLTVNPKGPASGTHRVLRGGAYDFGEKLCRVATRYMALPTDKDSDIGFRVARTKE